VAGQQAIYRRGQRRHCANAGKFGIRTDAPAEKQE